MTLIVKTLLVWLLVLAVPAQGMAAATMAFCGPGHHGGVAVRAELGVAAEHSHHGVAAAEHGFDTSAAVDAPGAGAASATEKPGPAPQPKCSACASCCSLGALLSTVPAFVAADPAPTVFVTVVPAVVAVAAGGPDRPPRNVLA